MEFPSAAEGTQRAFEAEAIRDGCQTVRSPAMTKGNGHRECLCVPMTRDGAGRPEELDEQVVNGKLLEDEIEQRRGPSQRLCSSRNEADGPGSHLAPPDIQRLALGGQRPETGRSDRLGAEL